jgi:hypothetical protein
MTVTLLLLLAMSSPSGWVQMTGRFFDVAWGPFT